LRARFRETSPIHFAARIQASVLLIHGEKDRTFPVVQARHLYDVLQSAGKGSELLIIPGASHVFNFIDKDKGRFAWEKTILFLNQYLTPFSGRSKERGEKNDPEGKDKTPESERG